MNLGPVPFFDPFDDARNLHRVWEHFIAGKSDRLERLRPIIRDSWLRCQHHVDPRITAAPTALSKDEMESVREGDPLYRAAAPVLRLLVEALNGERCVFTLLDRDLRQLEIAGHPKVIEASEEINGIVGSQWREDQMGTEAGLCLVTRAPVQVSLFEHYCEAAQSWVTSAAPILDPLSREAIGLLGVHGHNRTFVQPRALYNLFDDGQKARLFANYAAAMAGVPDAIVERQCRLLDQVHPDYGRGVREAVATARADAPKAIPVTAATPQHAAE